ncbi:RHS repeat-associated core domain-containing protein [Streptomyces sp. NBC_01314]|uniref:RHS repeat-associated core domain-containing protein n=1 Tax=Streptomyces sp. NBC_01314 TaxID=2903821 RepID=UPI00308684B2|nr:RHS repeat-associated core domain-containing protein [Streptomyces sp. NBC_01314]
MRQRPARRSPRRGGGVAAGLAGRFGLLVQLRAPAALFGTRHGLLDSALRVVSAGAILATGFLFGHFVGRPVHLVFGALLLLTAALWSTFGTQNRQNLGSPPAPCTPHAAPPPLRPRRDKSGGPYASRPGRRDAHTLTPTENLEHGNGATKALSGSRRYTAGSTTFAVRTSAAGGSGTKLTFLAGNHQGTSSLAIASDTLAFVKRYTKPFGAPRGAAGGSWPDDKGFLGRPSDQTTGLTQLGARQYDSATGRFLSVDPLLEPDKPQTLNGYAYSSNSPITNSAPTGMSDGVGGILGGISAIVGGAVRGLRNIIGSTVDAIGSSGGTAPTNSYRNPSGMPLLNYKPGATYNLITAWDTPFSVNGRPLSEYLATLPNWGIVSDPKKDLLFRRPGIHRNGP